MAELPTNEPGMPPVVHPDGVTVAERYLAGLCRRSFLSLWSYPGVYRDQGRARGKGDGKEVCDLLVVFENHILIFSDKDCQFPESINVNLAWARWSKKAIGKSADQLWGAERWIRQFPNRLFLDRQCSVPFPIDLPEPDHAIFHRILVAHDVSRRCRDIFGGSGSLMIDNGLIGDTSLRQPFTVGQLNPDRGFVHVFDDATLDIVMNTLDTISDFTQYLTKKEAFLTAGMIVHAAGEEELLAVYLHDLNARGEHDFVIKRRLDLVSFPEGSWENFVHSPERRAQIVKNRISYAWDELIERFSLHAMTGTQYFTSGRPLNQQEKMFRFMAREPRTRRRVLSIGIHEVLKRSIGSQRPWEARVMSSTNAADPLYIFLALKRKAGVGDPEYRAVRQQLITDYCHVAKHEYPSAVDIIGIATEDGKLQPRSEDLYYLDASQWTSEDERQAKETQETLGLLKTVKTTMEREFEYPVDHRGQVRRVPLSRNSPCWCGSRKRLKRCHGKEQFGHK